MNSLIDGTVLKDRQIVYLVNSSASLQFTVVSKKSSIITEELDKPLGVELEDQHL